MTITWYCGPWIITSDGQRATSMRLRPRHEVAEWTTAGWKASKYLNKRAEFSDPKHGWRKS